MVNLKSKDEVCHLRITFKVSLHTSTTYGLYRDGSELRGVYYSKPDIAHAACFSMGLQCDYPILLGALLPLFVSIFLLKFEYVKEMIHCMEVCIPFARMCSYLYFFKLGLGGRFT